MLSLVITGHQDVERKGILGKGNSMYKESKAGEILLCSWNVGCRWWREREKTRNRG